VSTSPKDSKDILIAWITLPYGPLQEIEYPSTYKNPNITNIRYNREPVTERELRWVIELEYQLLQPRNCLKCSEQFQPQGKFNRLCVSCNEENL